MFALHPRLLQHGLLIGGAVSLFAFTSLTMAEGGGTRTSMPPQYTTECAACHTAYPPGFLPAASWDRIMGNLSKHFGTDASLDAATTQELTRWIKANAASSWRMRDAPPQDRITRSAWFVRQHDEVSASTWKRPAIKSASNCAACHTTADRGDFNEDNVRIPR